MLLVGRQEGHPACKNRVVGAGVVICLERGANLHMAQLMPLPLTVSCFSKNQICFTFLVPAHLGSPGQRAAKRVCVCVAAVNSSYGRSVLICLHILQRMSVLVGSRSSRWYAELADNEVKSLHS